MPDIVEVHGVVALVGDLPVNEFEGRIFWVQSDPGAGLYRDNGVDTWDYVASAGGFANPMTDFQDLIVGGGSGVPDRLAGPGSPGQPLVGIPQLGGDPIGLGFYVMTPHAPLHDPNRFSFSGINVSGAQQIAQQGVRTVSRAPEGTNWIRGFSRGYTVNDWVTAAIVPTLVRQDQAFGGLLLQGSAGYAGIGVIWSTADGWQVASVTRATSSIGDYTVVTAHDFELTKPVWLRLFSDDGAIFQMHYSNDGYVWCVLEGGLDVSTPVGTVTSVGCFYRQTAAQDKREVMACVSWREGSI